MFRNLTSAVIILLSGFSFCANAGGRKPADVNSQIQQAFVLIKGVLKPGEYTYGMGCKVWLIDLSKESEPSLNVIIRTNAGADEGTFLLAQDGKTTVNITQNDRKDFAIDKATNEPGDSDNGSHEAPKIMRGSLSYNSTSKTISIGPKIHCTLN